MASLREVLARRLLNVPVSPIASTVHAMIKDFHAAARTVVPRDHPISAIPVSLLSREFIVMRFLMLILLGYCRVGSCASFPASTLGEECSVDAACINAETFGETPAYCAGVIGTQTTCGGGSASCLTLQGGFTGPSPVCASGMYQG